MTPGRTLSGLVSALVAVLTPVMLAAQGRGTPNPLRQQTRTIYTAKSELFLTYRPAVVGQESRYTAHLTRITDRFEAYPTTTTIAATFAIGDKTIQVTTPAPGRSGVFPVVFTPTTAGTGTLTLVVTAPDLTERFVVDNIPVETDLQAAIAHQPPAPTGPPPIRYTKEAGWDGRFATAPVARALLGTGKPPVVAVPIDAITQVDGQPHVYIQRDPEAFDLRPVKTGERTTTHVAIIEGVREGDRIVMIGADKLPRK